MIKSISAHASTKIRNNRQTRPYQSRSIRRAVLALIESLEPRTLLSTTFANLPFSDPFPAATQLGQPSQDVANVVYSESFTDQTTNNSGLLGDHFWNGQTTFTRALPAALQNGLSQMSVEFWFRIPQNTHPTYGNIGWGTAIQMPGFTAANNFNWGGVDSGVLVMTFTGQHGSDPIQPEGMGINVLDDDQWHQYTATFDTKTASFYVDGQQVSQVWSTNTIDQIGPKVLTNNTTTITPTTISYTPPMPDYTWNNPTAPGGFDEVRVSNVTLTPQQIKRNFENYRSYANTYYVSPTGLPTNTGLTTGSPFDLVTALSASKLVPDTKLILLPGTYDGSQFNITTSGLSPLHNILITGADGAGQAVIQTTGSTPGALVSTGVKYVTLRNLTFSTDQVPALRFSGTGYGNIVDASRITSNVDAMTISNSSGFLNLKGKYESLIPGVLVQNSIVAAGTTGVGINVTGSPVVSLRDNTIVGGATGASFTAATDNVTLLDNIFTGQSVAGVYFGDDSRVDHTSGIPSYAGDGNVYNPAVGGYVATIMVGVTANNYTTTSDYAKYWYTLQYGTDVLKPWGDNGSMVAYRSEQRSLIGNPGFVSSATGDFRLAPTTGNLTDIGADYVYKRSLFGGYPSLWDAQGSPRAQGNAIDVGAYETTGSISKTFTLTAAANTSAGVFDANGKLIRTLWSGLQKPAGIVTAYWNGLDDNKLPVASGNYTIKLTSNNEQFIWDGGMANSTPQTGPNIETSYTPFASMVVIGTTGYYAAGYNEGRYQLYKFDLANIHQTTGYGVGPVGIYDNTINHIATDGSVIFALAENPNGTNTPIITAYDTNFNSLRTAGVSTARGTTGIASQGAGQQDLLFVSHATDNKVYIYNKNTFAVGTTPYLDGTVLGWNSPQGVAVTSTGDLWVSAKNTATGQWQIYRYTNFAGTPTLAATVTAALTNPVGMTVSIDGTNTLLVTDTETVTTVTQQVKAFDNNGTPLWTLGQAGGYSTNGPTITNDKFILTGLIATQPDGSFWVTDLGAGNRIMHFSASRVFTPGDDITFVQSYNLSLDQNNSTRLFQTASSAFVEYQIDYTKPYLENQGWTPIRNWTYFNGQNLMAAAVRANLDTTFYGLSQVTTLSNGRTYAVLDKSLLTAVTSPSTSANDTAKSALVELTATGVRDTGYVTPRWAGYWLDKDGSFIYNTQVSGNYNAYRLAISSIDANGNPQYVNPAVLLATIAAPTTWDTSTPATASRPYIAPPFLALPNGQLAVYNAAAHQVGNHLGVIDPTTNAWQWQSMPTSGQFTGSGNYDTNTWYGGNRITTDGTSIFAGYNGEGWIMGGDQFLGQGQANQFMQYSNDGLFLGQFGTPYLINYGYANGYATGGNTMSPVVVNVNGTTYLFVNDEGHRSAMRWHVTGSNTVQTQSQSAAIGYPDAPSNLVALPSASAGQINLTWSDNASNETGFVIDRATNAAFTANLTTINLNTPNQTSYTDTGLTTTGGLYYYRIRSINAVGSSPNSAVANTVTGTTILYNANFDTPAYNMGQSYLAATGTNTLPTQADGSTSLLAQIAAGASGTQTWTATIAPADSLFPNQYLQFNVPSGTEYLNSHFTVYNSSIFSPGNKHLTDKLFISYDVAVASTTGGPPLWNVQGNTADGQYLTVNTAIDWVPTITGTVQHHMVVFNESAQTVSFYVDGALTGTGSMLTPANTSYNYFAGATFLFANNYGNGEKFGLDNLQWGILDPSASLGGPIVYPTLSIAATVPTTAEGSATPGTIRISRTGNTLTNLPVNYALSGSATNGNDYTTLSGAATIPAGLSYVDINVTPIDDTLAELTESATLTLVPNAAYTLGSTTNASVNITDNDTLALPTSLTTYLRLDENTGTTTNDTATSGVTSSVGTLANATWVAGRVGNAIQFNGTTSNVSLTDTTSSDLDVSTRATVSIWVKATTGTTYNTAYSFLSKASAYSMGATAANSRTVGMRIYIGTSAKTATYTIPTGVDITQWHHFAGTYDGTNVRLYMDGVQVGISANTSGNITVNNNALYLGRISNSYFRGSLDEARIYNAALAATDIAALYNQPALAVTGLSINSPNSASYSILPNGLNTGVTPYGDNAATFTTVPGKYLGSTLIKTANADATQINTNLMSFTVNQPVTIYILHNDSYTTKPSWLTSSGFTDTGDNILSTLGTFSVYKKVVSAGTITLGGNTDDGLGNFGMYSILIVP